jgi:hypothetical protein
MPPTAPRRLRVQDARLFHVSMRQGSALCGAARAASKRISLDFVVHLLGLKRCNGGSKLRA